MQSQLADFLSLLFPRTCLHCHTSLTSKENHLCLSCELSLPKYENSVHNSGLLKKFAFQPSVKHAFSYLEYVKSGISQHLVQLIKYKGKKELGHWLGLRLAEANRSSLENDLSLIIPLPLHPKRRQQRGYNQSEVISNGISESLGIPVGVDCVHRIRYTDTQTKKTRLGRWESMDSVFKVMNPDMIRDQSVMLFDDVITTGATMGMFCDEVAKCNPKSITVATLASGK